MQLKTSNKGSTLNIEITGHITGIAEVMQIKNAFEQNASGGIIDLVLYDAFVIPSSFIGILLKEAQKNKKSVRVIAHKPEIKELFRDLNLESLISVEVKNG